MGVIKKLLCRGDFLGKPRHRNLFLDMEENIHIHYRDLRIELSRAEFEEIVRIFGVQSRELLETIQTKGYQDGRLPNSNQDETRIWTESRLHQEVGYHPRCVSLEECGDGYHFHYRNYKLLIDKEDFRELVARIRTLDLDSPYAQTYDEVRALLESNEVDFVIDSGSTPDELLAISVAAHHLPKVRDIFNYIGFTREDLGNGFLYRGARLTVAVRKDKRRSAADYRRIRGYGQTGRLTDFLARRRADIDPNELNRLKCQALDLYFALKAGAAPGVETDPNCWLYAPESRQVVFPYRPAGKGGATEAERLYTAWSRLLANLQLGFIKPGKDRFAPEAQRALRARVDEAIRQEVAAFRAVERIYIMGSAVRGEMGLYRAPFIHGKLAKLGSDVDILVEIHPDREQDIAAHWREMNPSASNHCAVYHIAEVPLADGLRDWPEQYPHVTFIQHLIDAYVFFPSRGFLAEKDAFLRKFNAQLFYDRQRDGPIARGGEEGEIARRIEALYGLTGVMVERLGVSTENALFKVFSDGRDLVLKLVKAAGSYHRPRVAEHVVYEARLIAELIARGIPTAATLPLPEGDNTILGLPALLFERLPGSPQKKPEYRLDLIAGALGRIHSVQLALPLALEPSFHFDDVCMMWLPLFGDYLRTPGHAPELTKAFAGLAPLVERLNPGEVRAPLYARSPSLHNHGDVAPKNVILTAEESAVYFDFTNAYFGPRMADLITGAFEFALAEKYIDMADFARFDAFIEQYERVAPLNAEEREDLPAWIQLIGAIMFTKEIRVLLEHPTQALRRKRALAIAGFVSSRTAPTAGGAP